MAPVCVDAIGHSVCVGMLPAAGIVAIAVAGIGIALRVAFSWITGVAMSFAIKHTVLTIALASGVSIQALLPGGVPRVLIEGLRWLLGVLGLGGLA